MLCRAALNLLHAFAQTACLAGPCETPSPNLLLLVLLVLLLLHAMWPAVQAVVDVWRLFQAEFLQLWDEQGHKGDAYPAPLFGHSVPQGQQACQVQYSSRIENTICL